VLGPVYFIFTSKLPRRLVRRGFSFNHSEIEKGVFAAIRRASSFVSNFAADRHPGSRDTETGRFPAPTRLLAQALSGCALPD